MVYIPICKNGERTGDIDAVRLVRAIVTQLIVRAIAIMFSN